MRRGVFLGSAAAAAIAAVAAPVRSQLAPSAFALGDDVFVRSLWRELTPARVGIVTNQTGVLSNGVSVVTAARARGLNVRALFSPEHGLHGDRPAGAFVPSYVDGETGLPVYSLYGPDRHPSAQMLSGIDVLLFDIQDVGARAYTFISTMAFALQSAAAHGIEFWVLDRPNPVGGTAVEGPVLDPEYSSFVGLYPIAMRHGMTIGELAQLFNQRFGIGGKLRVVQMEGWHRSMIWPQTGLRWTQTSPNIPTWETTFVYLCTGLADSFGLNNGVGTQTPFFYAGAPRLDAQTFARAMAGTHEPGVRFDPATWSPQRGANAGRTFSGVRLDLTQPDAFVPVRTSVELLCAARDLRPGVIDSHDVREIDIDWGIDSIRMQLLQGKSASEIVESWQPAVQAFLPLRERFLMYS